MEYITKHATEDKIQETKYKEIVGDAYFDEHGILKPGYCSRFEIQHFALLALFQWSQENAHIKEAMYKKHRLRSITVTTTLFVYEVKTLVSMMHWDEFNKFFK